MDKKSAPIPRTHKRRGENHAASVSPRVIPYVAGIADSTRSRRPTKRVFGRRRISKAFRQDFERRSFQGVKQITEWLELVGFGNVFHQIASSAKENEDRYASVSMGLQIGDMVLRTVAIIT